MDSFWFERWRAGQIGFHEGRPNTLLEAHVEALGVPGRVLVPLCGKAEDLAFLASRGHTVIGCELVEDAVVAFFAEHQLTPEITRLEHHTRYVAGAITIFAGDYFALDTHAIGGACDALYDRAAVVALPPALRPRYAQHTRSLLVEQPPAVMVTFEYDQRLHEGPPFSVPEAEVRTIYTPRELRLLAERPDHRRPQAPAMERCWSLRW